MQVVKLEEKIIDVFTKAWELNDAGHRVEHFSEVYKTGIAINQTLKLKQDRKLLLFASYFHDLFAWSRSNHHKLSEEFILGTGHELISDNLTQEERILVAGACRKHRASNREPFSNFFEEFFNASDRERPKSVESMLERSMRYTRVVSPALSEPEVREVSVAHLKDKFGHNGYAHYPKVYLAVYEGSLKALRDEIAAL